MSLPRLVQVQSLESRRLLADTLSNAAPQSVLVDMNGDGKADLVSVSRASALPDALLTIALGRGDGRFAPSDRVVVHANTANALAVGDLDGDGALDVAVAGSNPLSAAPIDGTFVITAFGNGDGAFKRSAGPTAAATPMLHTTFVPEIARARALSLADVDDNGFGDVSVFGVARAPATINGTALVVHWDPTLLTFAPVPPTVVAFNSLTIVNQLHSGDLDGDGKSDLVLTNRTPLPPSPLTVIRTDLVAVRFPTGHTAAVRHGINPLNALPPAPPTNARPVIETFGLGNLNNDGKLELVGRRNSELRYASYNAGNTLFGPAQGVIAANTPPPGLSNLRLGDVTGDGLDDVLASSRNGVVLATNIPTATGMVVVVRWSRVGLPAVNVRDDDDLVASVS